MCVGGGGGKQRVESREEEEREGEEVEPCLLLSWNERRERKKTVESKPTFLSLIFSLSLFLLSYLGSAGTPRDRRAQTWRSPDPERESAIFGGREDDGEVLSRKDMPTRPKKLRR